MEYVKSEWNGYARLDFQVKGRSAILICPKEPRADGKWLLKTEYFGAFPQFELEMLRLGYHVAHIKNTTRWCLPEDTDAQADFCEFLARECGLYPKCMTVGMSCGGMQSVYLAARYPQYVAAMYLDAPVLNLLSCPCGLGAATNRLYEEFFRATGRTVSELLNCREHPIDMVDGIIEKGIPTVLVCGDCDGVVPYEENGKHLAEKYRRSQVPFAEYLKAGCDHHPHGLEDCKPLIDFAERFYR
ncbi:MAG: alpha/beta fold hydrolase [Ruminococcaceae bacterium]|nr:alpha/beta fold hydrolase [Oscillospiraceae bacterium]